jgi:di/tricarboxylate transporter
MTLEMWVALLILASAILLFITEWARVDVVALGVVVALMITELVTVEEAISGFANPAVLTIAALFIVGGAVSQTGLAGEIGRHILTFAGPNPVRLTIVIMVSVALLSGFMSDTGTVAVLLPAITSLALSAGISSSKLLIPLSYGALLGGAATLIGTPPNIIISGLLKEQGLEPFSFFDYTPVGLVLIAAGIIFMVVIGRRLLPDHHPVQDIQRVNTPEELMNIYRLPDNLFRLRLRRGTELSGKTLQQSTLGQEYKITIIDILRTTAQSETPLPTKVNTPLQVGDILLARGEPNDIARASAFLNLGVQPAKAQDKEALINNEVGVAEVLLPPRSALVGETLVSLRFGSTYNLTVLSITRPGEQGSLDLKGTKLRFGDTLLVQGPWSHIVNLQKKRRDFVVIGVPESIVNPRTRAKAPFALVILVGMLLLMVTNVVPVVAASLLAALAMILSGCLTIDDAYAVVDWKSIVLIAGMIPMSIALENVGLVELASTAIATTLGGISPYMVLGGLFLITSLFTQLLSNTATAVLIAPIGLAVAAQLFVTPYAFLMGIAIAASMAFATPVASPVNTLVMGAGHYRFSDYIKVGTPMIFIALLAALLFLPILWPF